MVLAAWQNREMRLWASCDSITFDELAPRLGEYAEVALGLSLSYIGPSKLVSNHSEFPLDLSNLGTNRLVQIPELGRNVCAVTGILWAKKDERRRRVIESAINLHIVGKSKHEEQTLNGVEGEDSDCEVLGRLHLSGKEWSTEGKTYYSARILRFQSLCLDAADPRFGTWFDVHRYGDLGSDPDTISADVCLAEIDLTF